MSTKISGRQTEVGIAIETTAGTPVSAQDFFKWESLSLVSMSDKVLLNSARGIRNKTSNSIVVKQYGKGSIEFVPTVDMLPYILDLFMGTKTSSAAHSGETTVYDHLFAINNANASMRTGTLTIKQGGIQTERYANCVVDSLDLTIDKDFAKCKIGILGNFPDTSAISPSYTQDTLFTKNQMLAYFGTSFSNAIGSPASTTLTSDTTAPADGSTIVIGSITYTLKTTLTAAGVPYEVFINTTPAAAFANLKKAINGTGTPGTDYGVGTVAHPQVIATTVSGTPTLLIVAIQNGTGANTIATTQAGTSHCTWSGTTMTVGTPGVGAGPTPLLNFTLNLANNVLFDEAFLSGSANPVAGGFVAGSLQIKGTYTLQFSDTVELAKYQQNTLNALVVVLNGAKVGTVPTLEQIILKMGKLVLTKAPVEYQLDGLNYIKQEFEVSYDATDKEFSATVTNTNAGANYL
jgi:hypothetical protein